MTDYLRDPELDEMVRALNSGVPGGRSIDAEPPAPEAPGLPDLPDLPDLPGLAGLIEPGGEAAGELEELLVAMVRRGASDLLLLAGAPPIHRVGGALLPDAGPPLGGGHIRTLFAPHLGSRRREALRRAGAVDFSLRLSAGAGAALTGIGAGSHRFRINVHKQRGEFAAAVRALPAGIPTLAQLGLPPSLAELVRTVRGLLLVCGPTGAGKSTTLAALIGEINRRETRHIVTIEDPIEYEHEHGASVVEQIEVGTDAPSFAAALRAALRQDPDVILVGEMRDLDTVATALTAAETGHLILSTLHTGSVTHAISRIVDVFPAGQQPQIRQQLALSLNAIVCQHLLPRARGGGRVPAVEVLIANVAVRNHIRNDRLQNIATEITLGRRMGMMSLEDSLARLVRDGDITDEEARTWTSRPEELESLLR